jgi:pimeloyl-ACP methyl ester carboxylesterase
MGAGVLGARLAGCALLAAAVAACAQAPAGPAAEPRSAGPPTVRYATIGGYRLAYECAGHGTPAVILEAGYTASGIDTYGPVIVPALARRTRVCTYDRAGDGLSDARPAAVRPLTGATQAAELHTLLHVIGVGPPYVLVGHSYGGMITREFAARYRGEVAGMVLIDASSEPEVAVYDRLHAGPWIDGTVQPAPNQRVNIHATVRQLDRAPRLGAMPLIVITAGILQDRWLKTVPHLEARAQTRLASLSTNSLHVLDRGIGHFIPAADPQIVIAATRAVLSAAANHTGLAACQEVFRPVATAECLSRGQLGHQQT